MKFVQSVLLALSFFGPTLVATSAQAQSYDCFDPADEVMEAACALMGAARQALNGVNAIASHDPNVDVSNAKRYCQFIINDSDVLAKLLQTPASDDALRAHLDKLETTVLQLDATKRKLKSRYPSNNELIYDLTRVRTLYFYLESLLFPEE